MEEHIEKMLAMEEQPKNIVELRDYIVKELKHSRGRMSKRYAQWDKNMLIFEGKRCSDAQDKEASDNDEPEKMIVPMSYTQVMTFCTFCYMLMNQNRTFFELEATGNEDYPLTECSEAILERDLRHNGWKVTLFELLQDLARFGIAATKTTWKIDQQYVEYQAPTQVAPVDGPFQTVQTSEPITVPVTKFEGNKVVKISPYRLIPDMRLPLTRWKDGKYVADETEYHIATLKTMEEQGLLTGVDHISPMTPKEFENSKRGEERFPQMESEFGEKARNEDSFMVILTEGQFRINGQKYGLSEESHECDYIITMANDNRITSIEKAGYLHGEFIYDIAQFSPDEHSKLSMALSDSIDKLQEHITYLINMRMISLRQGLDKHLIVNPLFIDTDAIEGRQPIIYVRPGAPMVELNKMVQQLQLSDPTVQNIPEAETLLKIMQIVTGVNENAMGQYAPGRRSATENRNANAGSASRMTLHASLFFEQLLLPMGRKMLTNSRQGLSMESFIKIIGKASPNGFGEQQIPIEMLYDQFAPADPMELVGNEDFFTFNSTSGSERAYLAQNLQELVIAMASNPQIAMLTQYDITKLIDEIQYLRGVRNVTRFKRPIQQSPAGIQIPSGEAGNLPLEGDAAGAGSQAVLPAGNVQQGAPGSV